MYKQHKNIFSSNIFNEFKEKKRSEQQANFKKICFILLFDFTIYQAHLFLETVIIMVSGIKWCRCGNVVTAVGVAADIVNVVFVAEYTPKRT